MHAWLKNRPATRPGTSDSFGLCAAFTNRFSRGDCLHRHRSGFAHRTPLLETLAAVDRSSLCRLKRHRRIFSALRTNGLGLDTLHTVAVTTSVPCSSVRLARLAPLGLVLETLVGEKHLFAGGEDELGITFGAFQNPILIFHTLLLGSSEQ
jgi:hypothetical protein